MKQPCCPDDSKAPSRKPPASGETPAPADAPAAKDDLVERLDKLFESKDSSDED
jgi:hypothetical protein